METSGQGQLYRVWGEDKVVYGPLDFQTLAAWIRSGRASDQSWVFSEQAGRWKPLPDWSELAGLCQTPNEIGVKKPADDSGSDLSAETLRRVKLFAGMSPRQCQSFSHYLEPVRVPQFGHLLRQGQRGDGMYIVLEGELRALTIVDGKESMLATVGPGDCFGEFSLLDQGPRAADVIANRDSVLLKLTNTAFDRLVSEAPALAVPFMLALGRAVVERIRRTTKRYEDSVRFIRSSGNVG
jgi:hypothetical protein